LHRLGLRRSRTVSVGFLALACHASFDFFENGLWWTGLQGAFLALRNICWPDVITFSVQPCGDRLGQTPHACAAVSFGNVFYTVPIVVSTIFRVEEIGFFFPESELVFFFP